MSSNTAYDRRVIERISSPLHRKRRELTKYADEGLLSVYRTNRLISHDQYQVLRNDIIYLFLDNIADEIQLVFTLKESDDDVLLKYLFTEDGVEQITNTLTRNIKIQIDDTVLNMYIEFTPSFLALDKDTRRLLLTNTELEWHRD